MNTYLVTSPIVKPKPTSAVFTLVLDHILLRELLTLKLHQISLAINNSFTRITRMVQLPATAAIEYVAACWVPGAGGIFVGGTRTRTKTRTKTKIVRGAYTRSPPSSMPIRTV